MAPHSTNPGHNDAVKSVASVTRPNSVIRVKSKVRTEYVITTIYNHLLRRNGFEQVTDLLAISSAERDVVSAFKEVVNDFQRMYSDRVSELCSQLEAVTCENVNSVYVAVLNELFAEGITWARIAALCVFSGELATQCLQKELPGIIVDKILDCSIRYIENMDSWISDHGGWEGVITFAKGGSKECLETKKTSNPGWARSMLYGTVRLIGTLAQIANSTTTFPMQSQL